jgi:hypothetical protein
MSGFRDDRRCWPYRTTRQRRRERRDKLKSMKITPTRRRRVFCVTITAIAMPQWAVDRRIKGLSASPTRIWLSASDARFLMSLDRDEGGHPWFAESEYRRCGLCNRPLLDVDAAARRYMDESTTTGKQLPCGADCIEASKDGRWR